MLAYPFFEKTFDSWGIDFFPSIEGEQAQMAFARYEHVVL